MRFASQPNGIANLGNQLYAVLVYGTVSTLSMALSILLACDILSPQRRELVVLDLDGLSHTS